MLTKCRNCDKFVPVTEVLSMKNVLLKWVQNFSWETWDEDILEDLEVDVRMILKSRHVLKFKITTNDLGLFVPLR